MKGENTMKKLLSVTLVLIFVLGCITFSPARLTTVSADLQDAYEIITQAIENLQDDADISSCKLEVEYDGTYYSSPQLSNVFQRILNNRPDLFYLALTYRFSFYESYEDSKYYISSAILYYTMDKEDIPGAITEVEDALDGIIQSIPNIDKLSQLEQALAVHEYIVLNYDYDYLLENGDVYSMITEGIGVCQAYTGLYMLVLRQLGIEVSYLVSYPMNHTWNLVNLDGNWYHVDNTWDDPAVLGWVYHFYFLQSDEVWLNAPNGLASHYDWEDDYDCDDTTYDSYYWSDVMSPVIFVDEGVCYYIKQGGSEALSGSLVKREGETETVLANITELWYVQNSTAYYEGCFSGLGLNGRFLYLNTPDKIIRFDTSTNTSETILTIDTSNGYIYGLKVSPSDDGCIITYLTATDPMISNAAIHSFTDNPDCPDGHNYGEWEVTIQPKEDSEGERGRTCKDCGNTETEVIPSLSTENGYVYTVEIPATTQIAGQAKWVHPEYGTFYTVIPKLPEPSATTLNEALTDLSFFDEYVKGFDLGSKIADYIEGDLNIAVYKADGTTVVTDDKLATGYIIKLFDDENNVLDTATVVIVGDTSGDGSINAMDYIALRLHLLDIPPMTGAKLKAADVDGNNSINKFDYIYLRLYLLGINPAISQN